MDDLSQCLSTILTKLDGKDKLIEKTINSYSLLKTKVDVNTISVAEVLTEIGFFKNQEGTQLNFSLYSNGILYKGISRDEISKFMLQIFQRYDRNCEKITDRAHKLNKILNSVIKKETFVVGILDECYLKEYRDTKKCTRLFFKNKIVVVEFINNEIIKKTETYQEFAKRGQWINSKKIIDYEYNFKTAKPENSDYKNLLQKVTNDSNHYLSLVSFIGFFISTHKSKKDPIIFILSDENSQIKNDAHGQSFKSEGIEAGIQFAAKAVFFENAQNFNKNFPFQNIRPEHDVFIFGDAPKDFNLKMFYEAKRGIDVELKARSKANDFINFEYAPKLLIDTNYRLGTNKSSDKGRIFRMTINNYFDADFTPFEEFNRELFTDWNKTDWNNFYGFIIECVSTYLQKGLLKYLNPKIENEIFAHSTSKDFVEFTQNELELDKWYTLSRLAAKINPEAYKQSKVKASKILSRWLKSYSDANNLEMTKNTGTDNKTFFRISEMNLLSKKD